MSNYNGTYKEDIFQVEVAEKKIPGMTKFVRKNSANFNVVPAMYGFTDDTDRSVVSVFRICPLNQMPGVAAKDHLAVIRKSNLDLISKIEGDFDYTNSQSFVQVVVPAQNDE